ncbi:hypothetical protein LXA43DRAFT_296639 [Ganoderma leucocontextum]|nr:hypothetical protein LXA43DRAFT_296639 [Ganoderma leucocontextum]
MSDWDSSFGSAPPACPAVIVTLLSSLADQFALQPANWKPPCANDRNETHVKPVLNAKSAVSWCPVQQQPRCQREAREGSVAFHASVRSTALHRMPPTVKSRRSSLVQEHACKPGNYSSSDKLSLPSKPNKAIACSADWADYVSDPSIGRLRDRWSSMHSAILLPARLSLRFPRRATGWDSSIPIPGFSHRLRNIRTYYHVAVSTNAQSGTIDLVALVSSTLCISRGERVHILSVGPRLV